MSEGAPQLSRRWRWYLRRLARWRICPLAASPDFPSGSVWCWPLAQCLGSVWCWVVSNANRQREDWLHLRVTSLVQGRQESSMPGGGVAAGAQGGSCRYFGVRGHQGGGSVSAGAEGALWTCWRWRGWLRRSGRRRHCGLRRSVRSCFQARAWKRHFGGWTM